MNVQVGGKSVLRDAVTGTGGSADIVRLLLDHGANPNAGSNSYFCEYSTLLFEARLCRKLEDYAIADPMWSLR